MASGAGPVEFASSARKALFDEALNQDSDQRRIAMAELLEMGAIDPLSQSVQKIVRKAVLQELHDYGQKYGSRLHVSVPGAPTENIDVQLFADNPAE